MAQILNPSAIINLLIGMNIVGWVHAKKPTKCKILLNTGTISSLSIIYVYISYIWKRYCGFPGNTGDAFLSHIVHIVLSFHNINLYLS